jgi:hypothetical protein
MVTHPKLSRDDISNPFAGPDIPSKSMRFGSLCQQLWYLLPLFLAQFRRRTRRRVAG